VSEPKRRTDPEKHKAQMRLQNQALTASRNRLIEAHRDEYEKYYAEEATKRGITPSKLRGSMAQRRQIKIDRLKQELAKLEQEAEDDDDG
jgi:hypothetical protein